MKTYFLENFTKSDLSPFTKIKQGRNPHRALALGTGNHPSSVFVLEGDAIDQNLDWLDRHKKDDLLIEYASKRWTNKEREKAKEALVYALEVARVSGEASKTLLAEARDRSDIRSLADDMTKAVSAAAKGVERKYSKRYAALEAKLRAIEQAQAELAIEERKSKEVAIKTVYADFRKRREKLKRQQVSKREHAKKLAKAARDRSLFYKASEDVIRTHGPGPFDWGGVCYVVGTSGGRVFLQKSVKRSIDTL